MRPRDGRFFLFLVLFLLVQLGSVLLGHTTYFWGDLTFLQHPWRSLCAEFLTKGEIPLWNPYAYMGMPLLANFQTGIFYPGSLLFEFFPYSYAMEWYIFLQYVLGAFFCLLWLRSWKFSSHASLIGASVWALGGLSLSRLSFLNQLGVLAWIPAFFLFSRRPILLGLSVSLGLLSGHPLSLGCFLAAYVVVGGICFKDRGAFLKKSSLGIGLGFLISACLILPGMELILNSERSSGVSLQVATTHSFAWRDFLGWAAPWLLEPMEFKTAVLWWKTSYLGWVGILGVALGFGRSSKKIRLPLVFYALCVALLMCGSENPISLWLWKTLPVFRWIRYPSHFSDALLPCLVLWMAIGFHRQKKAGLFWIFLVLELLWYGVRAHPTVRQDYYYDRGPLVHTLQKELGGHRYLLSGIALEWTRGEGKSREEAYRNIKHRLYGVSNLPYHLEAVGNFGEPLVPKANARWIHFLYSRSGLAEAGTALPYFDVRWVLTKDHLPAGLLSYLGRNVWHSYLSLRSPSRAYKILREPTEEYPLPTLGKPLEYIRLRSDSFTVKGRAFEHEKIFIAQPYFRGWNVFLKDKRIPWVGIGDFFGGVQVPPGEFQLFFRYDPCIWIWGLWLSVLSVLGLGVYWYNSV
ncbi:MAG: hypothetical protein HY400_07255 [Elusimicrobia bacterium]|nr:hypothetical protein [Elusimicrobiota bacterium]